jgi:UDP-N-acetylmuramoyl-L-alanyl-D-glutamate--2,6-diaminopimelate ligase
MEAPVKRLDDLLASIGLEGSRVSAETLVTGIREDSRRVEPGDLFVAVGGTAHDGADFAPEAAAHGAVAVIAERRLALHVPCFVVTDTRRALAQLACAFFDAPTEALYTVGVTGTNGKTTVCHWVAHLLGPDQTEMIGTVANEGRGLPGMTTPPSPVVQRIAREAVAGGKTNLVIEASSIGLAQRRLDGVAFDVAAFTNLTHDHFDLHGDLPAYLAAKARLFRGVEPDGWSVVFTDDPHAEAILAASAGRSLTVGLGPVADLRAADIAASPGRTEFRLELRGEAVPVVLPTTAIGSVENALVAVGVGICAGLGLAAIAERLRTVPRVPGRWEVFRDTRGTTAVVDFAHNPDALKRGLERLRGSYDRTVAVFGCPGGTGRRKRLEMGEISGRLSDLTVLTSDNPKDEAPAAILEEIAAGVRRAGGASETCVDRTEAVGRGVARAGPAGVVFLAGKGHERYQIVRGERIPYSDASVLADLGFAPVEDLPEGHGRRRKPKEGE